MKLKKLILFTFFCTLMSVPYSFGQFYFGGGMKFNTNDEFKALGLNAKVGKDIAEKIDFNGEITYYLASAASWSFNFDLHYKLLNVSDKIYISPMAGINFTRTTITNNSLSLGIAMRVPADKYTYFIEPRWILDHAQFVFSLGVIYPNLQW
ncbi:MAG: hypothetical protein IPL55_22425 [Saprospiraceae bacterium]|nr:hypothetical protein [Saprospiraceae bacterium]